MVISERILEAKAFDESNKTNKWENSSIRSWLNNDFYKSFNDTEKSYITTNGLSDKVFLLSLDDVLYKYLKDYKDRQAEGTQHAKDNELFVGDNGYSNWWLRTPGSSTDEFTAVSVNGSYVHDYGTFVGYASNGVRPAMWVSLGD